MRFLTAIGLISFITASALLRAQSGLPPDGSDQLHKPLDEILDTNVRDGLVYYRVLQSQRDRLDRYVATLDVPVAAYDAWPQNQKVAFWINAYNAFVLQTVVNRYPIRGRSPDYPPSSIRQIPGAFDRIPHRAAGRSLTLDEIEKTVLPAFEDPRLYLALGRGAIGSGRLRSEAYTAARLTDQLEAVHAEFVRDEQMFALDRTAGTMTVTPILSWNADRFVAAFDAGPTGPMAQRSPIERALVAFITPYLFPLEREFVQQNQFRVMFGTFDWRLNDLTGGAPK